MSFSFKTKNELAQIIPTSKCCQMAELAAIIRMDGTIQISARQKISLSVETENAAVARKIFKLTKELFDFKTEILMYRKSRLKKNNVYAIRIPPQPQVEKVLHLLGFSDEKNQWLGEFRNVFPHNLVKSPCCKRAYLRGTFLGGGSVNNPEGTYHLEIITQSKVHGEGIKKLMQDYHLGAKISIRKSWFVVYLKESEQIVNFLNLIGAHQALFEFENTRILKGMRNQVNRLVNCETANLNKTVQAAVRQLEAIKLIESTMGLKRLSPGLRQVAELRIAHPHVSLKELGEAASPPIGKSGISHRLRKLEGIAEKLKHNHNYSGR